MTLLPSILGTVTLGRGQVYNTSASTARSPSAPTLRRGASLASLASLARVRTEWLSHELARVRGEIRNITVLGLFDGRVVVAFQGQGGVRLFLGSEHSLEVPQSAHGKREKYAKHTHDRNVRFAEFAVTSLPVTVLVVGDTVISGDELGPCSKPTFEARTRARIAVSGHVTEAQRFPSQCGVPGRPKHAAAAPAAPPATVRSRGPAGESW